MKMNGFSTYLLLRFFKEKKLRLLTLTDILKQVSLRDHGLSLPIFFLNFPPIFLIWTENRPLKVERFLYLHLPNARAEFPDSEFEFFYPTYSKFAVECVSNEMIS